MYLSCGSRCTFEFLVGIYYYYCGIDDSEYYY